MENDDINVYVIAVSKLLVKKIFHNDCITACQNQIIGFANKQRLMFGTCLLAFTYFQCTFSYGRLIQLQLLFCV